MTYYNEPEEQLPEIPDVQSEVDRHRRSFHWLAICLAAATAILIPLLIWFGSSWLTGSRRSPMDLSGTTNNGVRTRIIVLDPSR